MIPTAFDHNAAHNIPSSAAARRCLTERYVVEFYARDVTRRKMMLLILRGKIQFARTRCCVIER